MLYSNINRNTLKALNRRYTKKDISLIYSVSPSTISTWLAKDSKGNYKRKSLRTKKEYKETNKTTIQLIKKAKPTNSRNQLKENRDSFIQGRQGKILEYPAKRDKKAPAEIIHYEYNFDGFFPELLKAKMIDIVDNNHINEVELSNVFIKLKLEMVDHVLNREQDNEPYQETIDYVSTSTFLVGQYDDDIQESNYRFENMDMLIARAQELKNIKYGVVNKVIETILVEKYLVD